MGVILPEVAGRHTTAIEWMVDLADAIGADAAVLGYQEGCTEATADCRHCWAKAEVHIRSHQSSPAMLDRFGGLTRKVGDRVRWTGAIRVFPAVLASALGRRRPTFYFPASRSDVFHERAREDVILSLLALAALRPDHRFVFPTKRWERAAALLTEPGTASRVIGLCHELARGNIGAEMLALQVHHRLVVDGRWPLDNVLIGASVGTQGIADQALPHMKALAEAGWRTWVSSEPRRGSIDWTGWEFIFWLVVGCESAAKARRREMSPAWVRSDRDWGQAADVPLYLKQAVINGQLTGRPVFDGRQHLGLPREWMEGQGKA